MNRKRCFIALLLTWFLMITSYAVYKEYSLYFGKEVMLMVVPVDPRDLFRGDYVILRYGISEISPDQHVFYNSSPGTANEIVFIGDTLYVELIKDGKYFKGGNIYKTRPEEGLFIKGTAKSHSSGFRQDGKIDYGAVVISYGIENFFVPEGEGKEIEHARNRNEVSAKIVINPYGDASIKALYIEDKKVDFKNKDEKIY